MEVNNSRLKFFRSGEGFRKWLAKNHASASELWVGFYRKDSGKGGITYAQALDEALCYGWIDGIRKKLDDASFTIRFTPRKPNSIWSNVNIAHIARLVKEGRMMPPGIDAYGRKDEKRSGVYSFERERAELTPGMMRELKKNKAAWKFFEAQPPYYKRVASWYVISAKRDETRRARLERLITDSARGERMAQFKVEKRSGKDK